MALRQAGDYARASLGPALSRSQLERRRAAEEAAGGAIFIPFTRLWVSRAKGWRRTFGVRRTNGPVCAKMKMLRHR